MATYTEIPNSDIETDKPIRAVTGRALRDNPIAIAEGAAGAPRIETNGINNGAVTNPKLGNSSVSTAKIANSNVTTVKLESSERMTTANVGLRTAGLTRNSVGSYQIAFANNQNIQLAPGATIGGSRLLTFSGSGEVIFQTSFLLSFANGDQLSGTWRYMGQYTLDVTTNTASGTNKPAGLFLRIS